MVWIGDPRHLPEGTPFQELSDISETANVVAEQLPVLPHVFAQAATPGTANLANAQGVIEVITRAVDLVQTGHASAICTAPIHKKVLMDGAGFAFPGHTEFLAHLAGDADVVMMLASDQLRVVPATIHVALSEVPALLTPELLKMIIRITHSGLRDLFGIDDPRIRVAGLNPHAGEGGAMGREELNWINGLVEDIAASGMKITGPASADTMFHARARDSYDAAIAMYHDQALIPIKTLDFDRGVNVTLGLPFVRTSPDHGTAFDIAGTGQANPTSMIEAIRMAHNMAAARAR
jgi:4-hydroxythreonine-4-phosphate dehydrogenase